MQSKWKKKFGAQWSFLRILRLGLSLLLFYEAWKSQSLLPALIGGILLWQAAWNTGCCGTATCDTDHAGKRSPSSDADAETKNFEEIK